MSFLPIPEDQRFQFGNAVVTVIGALGTIFIPLAIAANNYFIIIICFCLMIAAFSVLFIFFYRTVLRKRLVHSVILCYPILRTDRSSPTIQNRVKPSEYRGMPVTDMYLTVIKVENKGNTPIQEKDFNGQPLRLNFQAKMLDDEIELQDTLITNIVVQKENDNAVLMKPFDLGSHARFTFKMHLDREVKNVTHNPSIKYDFELLQDEQFRNKRERNLKSLHFMKAILISLLFLLSITIYIFTFYIQSSQKLLVLLATVTLVFFCFLVNRISNAFIGRFIEARD